MPDKIKCMVGDQERIIDMDVFLDAQEELAAHYRAQGLKGWPELDEAIVAALPKRLAVMLGVSGGTRH